LARRSESNLLGLTCIRCGTAAGMEHFNTGCPRCAERNLHANLTTDYDLERARPAFEQAIRDRPPGLWRYEALLPFSADQAVTLQEGGTPLVDVPRLARRLGLRRVWIKDESRNPTWSFKDRLASSALTMAKHFGAKVIASSSSGNAGAAAAAYAARAGLPCIVFTFVGSAGPLVLQMRAYGAMVVKVVDKADRWRLQSLGVREFGWYPTSPFFGPVVGSNPYGTEGYKTIAFEIAEAFDWQPPDWCVLPVCYGDALFGMWKGFEELLALGWIDRTPRFVAAEVSGSLTAAMASGEAMPPEVPRNAPSIATSIGAAQATVQGLDVLRRSRGAAVTIGDDDLRRWVVTLATKEGIWPEASSVAPFAAIERLRAEGTIAPHERCVALLTASGLKDPGPIETALPEPPLVDGGLTELLDALKNSYGFTHG
jgi:threonine synthase